VPTVAVESCSFREEANPEGTACIGTVRNTFGWASEIGRDRGHVSRRPEVPRWTATVRSGVRGRTRNLDGMGHATLA
jgi:hypothetical protein